MAVQETEDKLQAALAVAVAHRHACVVAPPSHCPCHTLSLTSRNCASATTQKRMALEQAAQQQHERELAAKSQVFAFRRAAQDLAKAHLAEFQRLRELMRHREDRFLAREVEPLDTHMVRAMLPVDPLSMLHDGARTPSSSPPTRRRRRRARSSKSKGKARRR